jgi:hypothetical protein
MHLYSYCELVKLLCEGEKTGVSKKNYSFAECHSTSTRQRAYALPSVTTPALGKEHTLCQVLLSVTRQTSVTVSSAVTSIFLAESRIRHSAKSLPSVQQKTLGKEAFADPFFAVSNLPSATLGKGFAECLCCFAECVRHSANEASLVVICLCS